MEYKRVYTKSLVAVLSVFIVFTVFTTAMTRSVEFLKQLQVTVSLAKGYIRSQLLRATNRRRLPAGVVFLLVVLIPVSHAGRNENKEPVHRRESRTRMAGSLVAFKGELRPFMNCALRRKIIFAVLTSQCNGFLTTVIVLMTVPRVACHAGHYEATPHVCLRKMTKMSGPLVGFAENTCMKETVGYWAWFWKCVRASHVYSLEFLLLCFSCVFQRATTTTSGGESIDYRHNWCFSRYNRRDLLNF